MYERALNTCCEPLSWKSTNMLMTNEDVQMISQLGYYSMKLKQTFFKKKVTFGSTSLIANNTM